MGYMKVAVVLFLFAASGMMMSGCGRAPVEEEEVLVTIGDTTITMSDFEERVANLPEMYREIARKRKALYVEEIINDTLLYQEAVRRGLDRDKDVQKVIEEATRKILIAKLLETEVDSVLEVTDEDIEAYYEENRHRYMTPEVMRASHILLNSLEDANRVVADLARGAVFEDIARARSLDPTAQQGGDIGYFPKGQLMPEFERACSRLEVGEVSGVTRTSLGYHVIKLTDRKPPMERPVETVREEIEFRLRDARRRDLFNELLERLKSETDIVVNEEALSGEVSEGISDAGAGDDQSHFAEGFSGT